MGVYKKNRLIGETIKQLPTAGLPLFESEKTKSKDATLKTAPKYIETGIEERNASYKTVCETLPQCRRKVYDAFKELGYATDREVSTIFDIPVNKVTARRNELLELGLMVNYGTKFDEETKREVNIWKTTGDNTNG